MNSQGKDITMKVLIFTGLFIFLFSVTVAEAQVIERNVQTGEVINREYTQQEIDDITEAIARELPARQIREAFTAKKQVDVEALGTRAELLAEIDAMVGVSPQEKVMFKKLAEIIYSNEKHTID